MAGVMVVPRGGTSTRVRRYRRAVGALHREVGHERFAAWWSEEAFWAAPDGAA